MPWGRMESYGPAQRSRRCDSCRKWIWAFQNCWTVRSFMGRFRAWVCESCFDTAYQQGKVNG
jgi:hypothetical protein